VLISKRLMALGVCMWTTFLPMRAGADPKCASYVTSFTDLQFSRPDFNHVPALFERSYRSGNRSTGWLGQGWMVHQWENRVVPGTAGSILLQTADAPEGIPYTPTPSSPKKLWMGPHCPADRIERTATGFRRSHLWHESLDVWEFDAKGRLVHATLLHTIGHQGINERDLTQELRIDYSQGRPSALSATYTWDDQTVTRRMDLEWNARGLVSAVIPQFTETAGVKRVSFHYDQSGRLIKTDDGRQNYRFKLDQAGRMVELRYIDDTKATLTYDNQGRLQSYLSRDGRRETLDYDRNGFFNEDSVRHRIYLPGQSEARLDETWTLDDKGRIREKTSRGKRVFRRDYHEGFNRVVSYEDDKMDIQAEYDNTGNLIKIQKRGGSAYTIITDQDGWITSVQGRYVNPDPGPSNCPNLTDAEVYLSERRNDGRAQIDALCKAAKLRNEIARKFQGIAWECRKDLRVTRITARGYGTGSFTYKGDEVVGTTPEKPESWQGIWGAFQLPARDLNRMIEASEVWGWVPQL